jgi:hypothetical protein
MRICGSRHTTGLLALLAVSLATPGPATGQEASYLNHDGFTRELRSLANGSDAVRMESLGTTLEGRDIWVLEVANPSGAPLAERPGVLVVANLEGDHVVGSHLALEMVRYLTQHADEDAVRAVLENQVVYVVPRLNPDGAEAMFARVKWDRRTNSFPFDDDNDGRVDEDGPEDLNGDGVITVMRVRDPDGAFMVDPDEPRLMKRADPSKGEKGAYTLYWEGTDSDNDGFYNEDGPGGVDLNRNFQHEYPYWQADAGLHMVSELETRALMDFVLAHRNIGAVLTFGLTDNLVTPPDSRGGLANASVLDLPLFADASNAGVFDVGVFAARGGFGRGFFGGGFGGGRGGGGGYLRGAQVGADNDPSSGTRPITTVRSADLVYLTAVSDAYKEITGISQVPVHRTPQGAFFQYGYYQFGVPSFSTPGWGLPTQESEGEGPGRSGGPPQGQPSNPPGAQAGAAGGRTPPAGGMTRMAGGGGMPMAGMQQARGRGAAGGSGTDAKVLKALEAAGIDAFVDWTPFHHTTLGEVEIGGFRPYATTNPPAEQVAELGAKHGEFLVKLAGMLPRVRIAGTKVEAHGGGVFTVTVHVQNDGFLPTSLQHGVMSRSVQPTLVQIQVPPQDVLTGADKSSRIQQLDGSGSRETFTWVIRGREGSRVEIQLRSEKGGTDTATVTLR